MSVAIVAEKPAVAREIARVLGADRRQDGCLSGNGYTVTWALGHLVTLPEPHEIDPRWRRWRRDTLPMIPRRWPLVVRDATRSQFDTLRDLLNSPAVTEVVCATDAGREGELIFRYIYEAAGCKKPVTRLWVSSLTPEAIRRGFRNLRHGGDLDPLADAARGRSRADWLVGMNLSRACTLAYGETLSVGRVQTPTLAMVVERELAIRAFVPEDYLEVMATFSPEAEDRGTSGGNEGGAVRYRGTYFRGPRPTATGQRLMARDGGAEEAARIVRRALAGEATIESVRSERRRLAPPRLYDLTELQRHANRLYGFSAKKTLALAQTLYETKKLITYPRTDSRHLSQDVAAGLKPVVEAIAAPYRSDLAPGTGERPLSRRFVDDASVTDHHAIIPTGSSTAAQALQPDEGRIYDLVCRRLLQAWHEEHVVAVTHVTTAVRARVSDEARAEGEVVDRYASTGNVVEQVGWRVLDPAPAPSRRKGEAGEKGEGREAQRLPAGLVAGMGQRVVDAEAVAKKTRPPRRFTEATLLTAMETAGRSLEDEELSRAMRDSGLGTPATRAEIIETLLGREYLLRRGKNLEATDKGIRLVERVHPQVKSPEMTGRWEAELNKIQRGEADLATFVAGIEDYVRQVVAGVLATETDSPRPGASTTPASPRLDEAPPPPPVPVSGPQPISAEPVISVAGAGTARGGSSPGSSPASGLRQRLRQTFGFESFRPYQEVVCETVARGEDVLLVMPTGAGKSLCYQLPGLARGGTTLVISPLIALMEDQVQKLREMGLAAERIHSGRSRSDSRQVSVAYLEGRLDFLFIAPERLGVPGFPQMLARRKPVLVAVDEAHCISHWGHDFRPDYRMLGERLPLLRPAPVIAMTATATPRVQDDIAHQLGLGSDSRFIHGFRRDNIAVEVAEAKPSMRGEWVKGILVDPARRPAIVYTPTRKEADARGRELARGMPAAAYHAGMSPPVRERVQAAFLSGEVEVIVATIAFGMGIDKADVRTVIHTGLPSSLEGYYQEIGRAGRDGRASRALLLYSWADRRTHEFFHERDYPEVSVLEALYRELGAGAQSRDALLHRLVLQGVRDEVAEQALQQLRVHGGARVGADAGDELIRSGAPGWKSRYLEQKEHKLELLADMTRFATAHNCRMLHLVNHFGDQEDSGAPCGTCDVCAPRDCLVRSFRAPRGEELAVGERVLAALKQRNGLSTGQLYRRVSEGQGLDRRGFDALLGGLVLSGLVEVHGDSFVKDGREIHFQRARLTAPGHRAEPADLAELRLTREPVAATRGRKPRPRRSQGRRSDDVDDGRSAARVQEEASLPASPELVKVLKEWRLAEARRSNIPAYCVFNNRTLLALAAARPRNEEELLAVSGIGPTLVRKYGPQVLGLLEQQG